MNIELGNLVYMNSKGAKELYKAYKIELHFPSEHYVTINKQTPRHSVELQIFHKFISTTNQEITNQSMKVNKAIVSILYTIGDNYVGDDLFNELAISMYNVNALKELEIAKKFSPLNLVRPITATYSTGFNIKALQGLQNALNANTHMYFYYGSETLPPCREEVLWMVYARPRSISETQFKFFKLQLAKHKDNRPVEEAKYSRELYGNKRIVTFFDDNYRGKIRSSPQAIRKAKTHSFFLDQIGQEYPN